MHRIRSTCAALLLGFAVVACADEESPPTDLRLADLVAFEERYAGEMVATSGVVRMFPDPEHYWIEDEEVNRVRIVPSSAVSDLVGERVRVVGEFGYDPSEGRVIDAQQVGPLE